MTVELSDENVEQEDEQYDMNPIAVSIDAFRHSVKDAEEVAYNFIPLAAEVHNQQITRIKAKEKEAQELLSQGDCQSQAIGTKILLEVNREADRIINANVPETIEKSLFLNLFSSFDTYIGDLISCIFHIKPELFNGLGRQISVSEILSFNDFDALKEKVLSDEIEALRRKSYVEQFLDMEKMFGVTLKAFDHWADFVELSQRRNLLMHCNGIISEQYIKVCKQEGYKFNGSIFAGSELSLDQHYMEKAFNLMTEVAIKLGHTLWRKIQPDSLKEADEHLSDVIYDYLHEKDWDKAICLGDFSLNQKNISSDLMSKINTINLVIAYKMSDQVELAKEVLNSVDWSAAINDFKLAHAVLCDDYDFAKEVMIRMGCNGEIIKESAYHNFPLFHYFRSSEQFLEGYKDVYGYSFISELKRKTDENVSKIDAIESDDETVSTGDLHHVISAH